MDAQHKAATSSAVAAPDAEIIARAQQHSMPLLPAVDHIDPAWQAVLDTMLDSLQSGDQALPEPLQPLIQELRAWAAPSATTLPKAAAKK